MSQSANKGLIFGIMMGTAGISLIIVWYQKIRKPGSMNLPKLLSLSNEFNSISLQDAVHNERGTVVLLQQSQFQILEKLNDLLMSVEELKEEVKFLKEAIPELEKYVRVELRGNTAMHRTTPQHQAARKKKAKPGRGISTSNSSEEAESEGGYVTAQSDTEKGHLFGHKYKDETEFMWRLVRAYGDMYELSTNMGEKKKYASDGKDLGERAVSQAPKNGYCHLWYGNICGLFAECGGLQNRVKYGHLFKEHIDKALELIPDEPLLYYLNGRYCYSVFKLNWMEKKMASTLFGMVPTSSIEDALNNFLKAEELKPGYSKYNYVYLAKCYKELGNKAKALMYCDAALLVSSDNKRDHEAQVELENVILSLKQI
ncbi:regulator of microtubule dynamics protein 2 isoform X4 [Sarcophilus harrisii]|uniref:regulator of microtubule dynamics protein 2 isoform X4 n=1 Tax=Sarcophilus harrisii TaxID=9305 RepID=UPI001301C155|nr:regulator of microtubule dynamics protein 2 isoform X4 [Sarcophilus harrisii]